MEIKKEMAKCPIQVAATTKETFHSAERGGCILLGKSKCNDEGGWIARFLFSGK